MVEIRENEYKTLSAVKKLGGKGSLEDVITESGLPHSTVMRAVLSMQKEEFLSILETESRVINLTREGCFHAEKGLPERLLAQALEKAGGKASLKKVVIDSGLEQRFVPIAIGWIQQKKWATLNMKTNEIELQGKPKRGKDEELIEHLLKNDETMLEKPEAELQNAVETLRKRKLLRVKEKTRRIIKITKSGRNMVEKGLPQVSEITQLTPELIVSGKWRKIKLQKYNISAPVARVWPGKRHPYMQFLDEVKEKLVTLGFKEMTGNSVETSFFNFDTLYTPQDHPAREIFSIYYVKSPKYGDLKDYMHILKRVNETHENGWKTGSTGWKYDYSNREAKRLVLRGHGTCLSIRALLQEDLQIPGKYFSIARCYRPDVIDKTHLTEFNQVEGIVIDENLNLRDLLGVLRKFAFEIADADKVEFRPDYFPFTEPSVELAAYKKGYGWIEFGGSGIFRPEVTLPLGIKVPVIAWGLGIDRLFMMKAEIDDIRYIFSQNLDWIRRKEMI